MAFSSDTSPNLSPAKMPRMDSLKATLTRQHIEQAVKKLEFGRISSRSKLYMREEILTPSKRQDS